MRARSLWHSPVPTAACPAQTHAHLAETAARLMGYVFPRLPVRQWVLSVQGCLQHMLSGRNATWRAILVSNAVFSISHQHLGLAYALLVFVPGLFWGWLYQRHRSLVGVCVSHVLIGLWVTGMLDLSALVQR